MTHHGSTISVDCWWTNQAFKKIFENFNPTQRLRSSFSCYLATMGKEGLTIKQIANKIKVQMHTNSLLLFAFCYQLLCSLYHNTIGLNVEMAHFIFYSPLCLCAYLFYRQKDCKNYVGTVKCAKNNAAMKTASKYVPFIEF